MFVLELAKPSCVRLVAVQSEEVIGYLICSKYDAVWHIMNLAIDPNLRRGGTASKLLDELFCHAKESSEDRYTLEVRLTNTAAIKLYERYGFLPAGIRKNYYQDNGEDALVMWRTKSTLEGRLDDVPAATKVDLE